MAVTELFSPHGQGPMLLTDGALVAAYLRRLGIEEREAASFATGRPLANGSASAKDVLADLLRRHILRIPLENLEQFAGEGSNSSTAIADRVHRLLAVRQIVQRLAFGNGGGVAIDLNSAFAWILKMLGATVRLSLAQEKKHAGGDYVLEARHVVILVDMPDGTFLVDPGFEDPPRAIVPLNMDMTVADELGSSIQVIVSGDDDPSCFDRVLWRRHGDAALCRHLSSPCDESLDAAEKENCKVYAFASNGSLALDSQQLGSALQRALTADNSAFTTKGLVCLATPKGHIVLTEGRSRRVEAGIVVQDEELLPDAWLLAAQQLFSLSFACPPAAKAPASQAEKRAKMASRFSGSTPSLGNPENCDENRRPSSTSTSGNEGKRNSSFLSNSAIAVGGAGQGGGLGLNAPGAGPRVSHFAPRSSTAKVRAIKVEDEVHTAWLKVRDEEDASAWIVCQYSPDFKSLGLAKSGTGGLHNLKEALGDSVAWGAFRCYGVDKRGGLECKRPKYVFVQYKPESISAIIKAKVGAHKGDIKDAMPGTHLDIIVETMVDLDEEGLMAKLQAATGAHKPNGYMFEDGVFLESDFYGLGIGKECAGESARN